MVTKIKFLILLLAILPCLISCGHGTETGNPGGPALNPTETGNPSESPGSGCPALHVAQQDQAALAVDETEISDTELHILIEHICLRLFICDSEIHTLDCIETLNSETGDILLETFGLDTETWTIGKVHLALSGQNLFVDEEALDACQDDILAIDCAELPTSLNGDDLSVLEELIPDTCADVFSDDVGDGVDENADPCA